MRPLLERQDRRAKQNLGHLLWSPRRAPSVGDSVCSVRPLARWDRGSPAARARGQILDGAQQPLQVPRLVAAGAEVPVLDVADHAWGMVVDDRAAEADLVEGA